MDQTSRALQRLGAAVRDRAIEIAKATELRVHDELFDYYQVPSPDFQEAGYAAAAGVIACAWATLEDGGRPPDRLPPNVVNEALDAARADVPLEILDRSYHINHELLWDALVLELASWRLTRAEHTRLLQIAARCMFRCFDFITTEVRRVYETERAGLVNRRQRRLIELVTDVLAGLSVSDAELGYGTGQQHVAVVGWGRDPQAAISRAARALSAELLLVPSSGSGVWAWLGRPRFGDVDAIERAFAPDSRTYVALGSVESGRRGFATSHLQAQLASSVAVRQLLTAPRNVIAYPHVAVETLLFADETRARIFAAHVLGSLADDDPRSLKLRDTLRAYWQVDQSTVLAARRLGIAERTVRHRLRAAEERLGGAAGLQRVALALRVFDALDAQNSSRTTTDPHSASPREATNGWSGSASAALGPSTRGS